MHEYEGELDEAGRAFGYGETVNVNDPLNVFKGTFLDNKPHGLCKLNHSYQFFTNVFIGQRWS